MSLYITGECAQTHLRHLHRTFKHVESDVMNVSLEVIIIKKIIPVVLLSLPTDLVQKYNVFRAQLNDVKCDFRVDGMSNKRNLEPPSFPLPAVFTLFTPAPNLVLLLGNNMNFLPAGV